MEQPDCIKLIGAFYAKLCSRSNCAHACTPLTHTQAEPQGAGKIIFSHPFSSACCDEAKAE